jgi:DNA-binding transcriptional regulator YdaS (Cro superfamily)
MPYPSKPKQPRLGDETALPGVVAPIAPPAVAQVVAGAPQLPSTLTPSIDIKGLVSRMDLNTPLRPAVGSGGPERWDRLARDTFTGDRLQYTADVVPHPFLATEVMADYPQAVSAFRDKLMARRDQLSPQQVAKSAFWKKFDTQGGQAFAAKLLADVMGLLTAQQRFDANKPEARQLTPAQQEWVRSHPLTRWIDWF